MERFRNRALSLVPLPPHAVVIFYCRLPQDPCSVTPCTPVPILLLQNDAHMNTPHPRRETAPSFLRTSSFLVEATRLDDTAPTTPCLFPEDARPPGVSRCNLIAKGALEAPASLSSFLRTVYYPLFPQPPRRRSREVCPQYDIPGPQTSTGLFSGRAGGCGKNSGSLPLRLRAFAFTSSSERADLWVPGDHGAARGVRSLPTAAGRLGSPRRGKRASLGPWTLQFLYAISGARPPAGNAGQGCKTTPWEAGRRAQRNGGSVLRVPGGGEMQRGPSFIRGEPRPGPPSSGGCHVGVGG